MKKLGIILSFSIALLSFIGCQKATDTKKDDSSTPSNEASQDGVFLESLPNERLLRLYNEATNLDYVFNNLPISMSMDNLEAIRTNLRHIDASGITVNPSCKNHDGNMIFSINGEIVEECYFYYRDACKYYIWIENGKPKYGNAMNDSGKSFMKETFSGKLLKRAQ